MTVCIRSADVTKRRLKPGSRGFTILEILVVVAILGILSAIAIWNYYLSIQRARQKRTIADMRTISVAWESRAADTHAYNAAAAPFEFPEIHLTPAELQEMLSPTYIRTMPNLDAWGNPLDFGLGEAVGGPRTEEYAIRCLGRDGQADADYSVTETEDFDCDIVYSNGTFVVYPSRELNQQ